MLLPRWDRELDALKPDSFNDAIRGRIRSADAVITFLFADDQSAAVEAAMAALAEKPQLIVARDKRSVPRIIAGLPSLVGIVKFEAGPQFQSAIAQFFDGLSGNVGSTRTTRPVW
jgi:hypothetical protein